MLEREKQLTQEITEIALGAEGKFRIYDFIDGHNIDAPPEKVLEILFGRGLIVAGNTPDLTPSSWFFRKGKLLIQPLQEEIDEGILIPGHRFVPFYLPELLPNEIELKSGKEDFRARIMITKPLKGLYKYYVLFGLHYVPELLAEESGTNLDAIRSGAGGTDTLVRVSVFDMEDFYKSCDFSRGDFILCELDNFRGGVFTYSHAPAGSIEKSRTEDWRGRIDKGFTKMFKEYDSPSDNFQMLAHAYYFAGRKAVTNPGLHLGGYINNNDIVEMTQFGSQFLLWKKDETIDLFQASQEALSRDFENATGTIESILADIGLSLNTEEIEAYMRDAFYHEDSFFFTTGRILHRSKVMFASKEQEDAFYSLLLEYWNDLEHEYSRSDDKYGGILRDKLLRIHHAHLLFLREMDEQQIMPEEMPEKEFWELRGLVEQVENVLAALNTNNGIDRSSYEEMLEMLEPLETIFSEITGNIRHRIGMAPAPAESRFYYIVHISIEGIDPPIWRGIRIPGNCSLRELHNIIQLSFGWWNHHLHSFYIGGVEYTDMDFFEDMDGEEDVEDEGVFLIEDLGLEREDSFTYVYDYGDNWKHELLIEEVLPADIVPEEERAFGVCIGGEMAAPLEDCGGIVGYSELIEVLKRPEETVAGDERDLRTWAGDYDPSFFDIDRTNGQIRRYMY